jgi:hypothetical protein
MVMHDASTVIALLLVLLVLLAQAAEFRRGRNARRAPELLGRKAMDMRLHCDCAAASAARPSSGAPPRAGHERWSRLRLLRSQPRRARHRVGRCSHRETGFSIEPAN